MNLCRTISIASLLLSVTATYAQQPKGPEATPRPRGLLPKPLERVETNLKEIEKSGHLEIVKSEYHKVGSLGEPAVIWTIRTKKPVTFRHVQLSIEQFRYAKFYAQGVKRRQIDSALVFYSDRVDQEASRGTLLQKDEEIQLWIYLDLVTINRLRALQLDFVLFGRVHDRRPARR